MRLTEKQQKLSNALWMRLSLKMRSIKERYDQYGFESDRLEYDDMRTQKLEALTYWDWEDCMYAAGYGPEMIDAVRRLTPKGIALHNKIIEYSEQ